MRLCRSVGIRHMYMQEGSLWFRTMYVGHTCLPDGTRCSSRKQLSELTNPTTPPPRVNGPGHVSYFEGGGHWQGGPCFFFRRGGVH